MPKRKSCLICWRESFLTITSRLLLTKHETYGKVIIKLYDAIQNKVVGNFELAYGDRSRCNEHYRNVVFNQFAVRYVSLLHFCCMFRFSSMCIFLLVRPTQSSADVGFTAIFDLSSSIFLFIVSYPPNSRNRNQPKLATCSEVSAICKCMPEIWGILSP